MSRPRRFSILLAIPLLLGLSSPALANPPKEALWWDGFGGTMIKSVGIGGVLAIRSYQSNLIIGGSFSSAGGVSGTENLARWGISGWEPMGVAGVEEVQALTEYGGDLIVAGRIRTVAGAPSDGVIRWDGSVWSGLGSGVRITGTNRVHAALPYAGSLVVGGRFAEAGGLPAAHAARWDGSAWSGLGSGMDAPVHALTEFNGDLIAGGAFTTAGGSAADAVARWDGVAWSKLGNGLSGSVYALAVFQGGLIAGGDFSKGGGDNLARWTGHTWQPLGGGTDLRVDALSVSGDSLYVGGWFQVAGGDSISRLACWDGSSWSSVGGGVSGNAVRTIHTDPASITLGGDFVTVGGVVATDLAEWDGNSWSGEKSNPGQGLSELASAAIVHDGTLVVGGRFETAGDIRADGMGRWDGNSWTPIGGGVIWDVRDLAVFEGDLIACGAYTADGVVVKGVARWDGSGWQTMASATDNRTFETLVVHLGALYVGGTFQEIDGEPIVALARLNGAGWEEVGSGLSHAAFEGPVVNDLLVYQGDLIVGGLFSFAGSNPQVAVARWGGSTWSQIGSGSWGISPEVASLEEYEGDLVVAGDFDLAGGNPDAQNIAIWDGGQWSPLGGLSDVQSLLSHDGILFAGGFQGIHRWNGTTWIDDGLTRVRDLVSHSGYVHAVGDFTAAFQIPSFHVARLNPDRVGVPILLQQRLLLSAYPNPFAASTNVLLDLEHAGLVRLTVFDLQGRPVATLSEGLRSPGPVRVRWTGADQRGRPLPSGVYYLSLETEDGLSTRSIVLRR